MRKYMKRYKKRHPEKAKLWDKISKKRLRQRVIAYLGGPRCVRCGCNDGRVLEINHKKGHGAKDVRRRGGFNSLYWSILKEKRKREFEVLCRVCNAAHYCELKYGLKFRVQFP